MIDFISDVFSMDSSIYYFYLYIGSFEIEEYNLNYLVTSPSLSELGYLNVESIKYSLVEEVENETFYFGIDFYETLASDNKIIPEPSLNEWKTYYFSLIDNVENEYTRIYHLENVYLYIMTCTENCLSCWKGHNM